MVVDRVPCEYRVERRPKHGGQPGLFRGDGQSIREPLRGSTAHTQDPRGEGRGTPVSWSLSSGMGKGVSSAVAGFQVILPSGASAFFAEGVIKSVWVESNGTGEFYVAYADHLGHRGDLAGYFTLDAANRFAAEVANAAGIHDFTSTVMVPDAREYLDSGA